MPQHAGHSGKTAGVPVLPVNAESIFPADLIKGIYPFLILFVICGLDADNCVQRFSAGVDQCSDGQFQFSVNAPLLINRNIIRFDQRKAVIGNVGVRDPFPVKRVEPDPRSCIRFRVTDDPSRVSVLAQGTDQFSGGGLIYAFPAGKPGLYAFFVGFRQECRSHISHIFIPLEKCPEIFYQFLRSGSASVILRECLDLKPLLPDDLFVFAFRGKKHRSFHRDRCIFVHRRCVFHPRWGTAGILAEFHDRGNSDR